MTSKSDIKDLFKSGGKKVGLDDESSSILIANLNGTTIPMCQGSPFTEDEKDTDDFRVVFLCLDGSTSMEDVENDVVESVNDVLIPGLLEGAASVVGGIRIGGLVFGSDVSPLWKGGFHPLSDVPKLTSNDYRANGSTALYRGVLAGITAATAYALDIEKKTGTNPEVVIAVISDGANRDNQVTDPADVAAVTSKLNPELFTLAFLGFETWEHVDFRKIAAEMGFRDVMEAKAEANETAEARRRRFRHLMNVFSQSLTNRVSSSRVGQPSNAGASTGFWGDK